MTYPIVTLSSGLVAYNRMATMEPPALSPAQVESRGGATGDESVLEATLVALEAASSDAADLWHVRGGGRGHNDKIEAAFAIESLHPALDSLQPTLLGDPDFWRFLTFNVLHRLISAMNTTNRAYLGLIPSSFQDCVPLMMFNRADLSLRHARGLATDPSDLYAIGADFWRSHILRVANRFDDTLVRAMLSRAMKGDLPTSIVRLVAPDLKARRASIFLGALDEGAAADLLDESIRYVSDTE